MGYSNGVVAVGTAPTLIKDPQTAGTMLLQSQGTAPNLVYIGGSAVAASGAGAGVALPAAASASVPGAITALPITHYGDAVDKNDAIYGVTSSGTVNVAWVCPT